MYLIKVYVASVYSKEAVDDRQGVIKGRLTTDNHSQNADRGDTWNEVSRIVTPRYQLSWNTMIYPLSKRVSKICLPSPLKTQGFFLCKTPIEKGTLDAEVVPIFSEPPEVSSVLHP